MRQRIENLSFEGVIVPLAEVEIISCWSNVDMKAKTHHKDSSIRMIEDEELITELNQYKGGNIFNEGMQSLSVHLADPTVLDINQQGIEACLAYIKRDDT